MVNYRFQQIDGVRCLKIFYTISFVIEVGRCEQGFEEVGIGPGTFRYYAVPSQEAVYSSRGSVVSIMPNFKDNNCG